MGVHKEFDSVLKNPRGHALLSLGASFSADLVREGRVPGPI